MGRAGFDDAVKSLRGEALSGEASGETKPFGPDRAAFAKENPGLDRGPLWDPGSTRGYRGRGQAGEVWSRALSHPDNLRRKPPAPEGAKIPHRFDSSARTFRVPCQL